MAVLDTPRGGARANPLRATTTRYLILAASLVGAGGCVGKLGGNDPGGEGGGGGNGGGGGVAQPGSLTSAPAHVRRLSATEIRYSMRDLFDLDDATFSWETSFPAEGQADTFDNQFDNLTVSSNLASSLQSAAEWAAAGAAAKLSSLLPCAASATNQAACAAQFVDTYGVRVFRRPLTAGERARYLDAYQETRAAENFRTSIATLIEAMLQSPHFLFRTELGDTADKSARLTPYELSSALSYMLWRSTPDQALLDAAAQGELATRDQVRAQAQRMIADPRAAEAATAMFVQWLAIGRLPQLTKGASGFSPAVGTSMLGEMTTFFSKTVWGGSHGFQDMFNDSSTFIDGNLATLYGVPAPGGAGLSPVTLDSKQRAGFFTMPGFITMHTPGTDRGPIGLGKFVRFQLLCQELPPPPADIPPLPIGANINEKKKYAQHEADPGCNACHSKMDPLGFGWSQFDVLGRFQPQDYDLLEDGSGSIVDTDVDGPFTGPVELGKKLSSSKMVQSCFAGTVARWALGRDIESSKKTSADVKAINEAVAEGFADGDLKDLFVSIVTSDAFLLRDTTAVPPGDQQ